MPQEDITNTVERLELFEERLGVRIEGLYAKFTYNESDKPGYYSFSVGLTGELQATKGSKLKDSIFVVAVAYDTEGRVIGVEERWFNKDCFFGLETFEILIRGLPDKPSKIRVYPKRR